MYQCTLGMFALVPGGGIDTSFQLSTNKARIGIGRREQEIKVAQ